MNQYISSAQLGAQWACHRTTAFRIMKRYGCLGVKSCRSRGAMRRFPLRDVERVERAMAASKEVQP